MDFTISHNYVTEILEYSVITGDFFWKYRADRNESWNKKYVGKIAGSIDKTTKYMRIFIDGKTYRAHRLAWFYVTGENPPENIDHINRDRMMNSWINLREATPEQNQANKGRSVKNTSEYKGVSFDVRSGKWKAAHTYNGKYKNLGRFPTKEEAYEVYCIHAKNLLGEFAHIG